MVDLSLFLLAILGGLVSFISPCNMITLPSFISYITSQASTTKKAVLMSLFFSLGFILIFSIIAILFIVISGFIRFTFWLKFVSGLIIIALSVYLYFSKQFTRMEQVDRQPQSSNKDQTNHKSTVIEDDSKEIEANVIEEDLIKKEGILGSFMLGFSLGSSWIGCITPIYLTIVVIASNQGDLSIGLILFILYAIGIMIPYIFIGASMKKINQVFFVKLIKVGSKLQKVFAIILLYIGIEMVLSAFGIPGLLPFV